MIAAPCMTRPPDGDALAFSRRESSTVSPIPEAAATRLLQNCGNCVDCRGSCCVCASAMWKAGRDSCPLSREPRTCSAWLGSALLRTSWSAKYAGQWSGFPGEPWSVRLQRWLLGSRWWRGIVTVYGQWPNQPKHVVPFFTSVMTPQQIDRARQIASSKRPVESVLDRVRWTTLQGQECRRADRSSRRIGAIAASM